MQSLGAWGDDYHRTPEKTAPTPWKICGPTDPLLNTSSANSNTKSKARREGERPLWSHSSPTALADRIQGYAQECRIEDLYFFVKNNRKLIPEADTLAARLADYRRVEGDVALLKNDPANRPFLESAYGNLLAAATRIPQVGSAVLSCAKKNYLEDLVGAARIAEARGDESAGKEKYREAMEYLVRARTLELPQFVDATERDSESAGYQAGLRG